MITQTPVILTECISTTFPTIKGTCFPGTINVYNDVFELVKTITVTGETFYINLEDIDSNAFIVTNITTGKTESLYSKITIKCCNVLDEYPCTETKKCNKC